MQINDNNINFDLLLSRLESDTQKWATIGQLKEKQKLQFTRSETGEVAQVQISKGKPGGLSESIVRTFSKLKKNVFADAKTTVDCLTELTSHLFTHIQSFEKLVYSEKGLTPDQRVETVEKLEKLSALLLESSQGLQKLAATYGEKTTKEGSKVTDLILARNADLSTISHLSQKVQYHVKEQQRLYEMAGKLDQIPDQITQLLRQSHATVSYEARDTIKALRQEVADEVTETRQEDTADSLQHVRNDVKGNGVNIQLIPFPGTSVNAPTQFVLDLPRSKMFKINDEIIYKMGDPEPEECYKTLCELFGDTVAARMGALLNQANTSDINREINQMYGHIAQGRGLHLGIETGPQGIHLFLKVHFWMQDPEVDSDDKYQFSVIVVRDILIPVNELFSENVESDENPFPHLHITDSYSKRIYDRELADKFLAFL